jgi:hypothetical protein
MTVGELIEALQQYDDEATVLIGVQPSWPFEHGVANVMSREETLEYDEAEARREEEANDDGRRTDSWLNNGKLSDVFIAAGGQIRYGSKEMW